MKLVADRQADIVTYRAAIAAHPGEEVPLKLVHFSPFFGQILLIYLILDLKEFELYFPVEKNKRKRDPILPPSGKVGWMDLGRRFPSLRAYAPYGTLFFFL